MWLAQQGWDVTAVDVSATAMARGAAAALTAGVADRIDWQRHDLAQTAPEGTYDLVNTAYLDRLRGAGLGALVKPISSEGCGWMRPP